MEQYGPDAIAGGWDHMCHEPDEFLLIWLQYYTLSTGGTGYIPKRLTMQPLFELG